MSSRSMKTGDGSAFHGDRLFVSCVNRTSVEIQRFFIYNRYRGTRL